MIAAFTLNVSIDRRYVVAVNRPGAVNRVQQCTYSAGGKGLNVARVLHTLHEPVLAGGIVGGDAGNYIIRRLQEEGIAQQFTSAAGESRTCINILDAATGTQTEYLEPGMQVSPEEYADFLKAFDDILTKASVISLSGSLPKGLSPETYGDLITRARAAGVRVLLDASGEALRAALDKKPYYVKPNEDELSALLGIDPNDEAQVIAAAKQLHQQGIANVVVSMGSRGALLVCDQGVLRGYPPKLQVVNTVGCGDAMTAAFAAATLHDMSPADALRHMIAVSAASALSPGTGEVSPEDVQQLYPQVRIDILS